MSKHGVDRDGKIILKWVLKIKHNPLRWITMTRKD